MSVTYSKVKCFLYDWCWLLGKLKRQVSSQPIKHESKQYMVGPAGTMYLRATETPGSL